MNVTLALFGLGGQEVLLIFGVFLLLFGAKKIPDFAKGLGQGIKEFKKATKEVTDEIHREAETSPPSQPRQSLPATVEQKAEIEPAKVPSDPPQRG